MTIIKKYSTFLFSSSGEAENVLNVLRNAGVGHDFNSSIRLVLKSTKFVCPPKFHVLNIPIYFISYFLFLVMYLYVTIWAYEIILIMTTSLVKNTMKL